MSIIVSKANKALVIPATDQTRALFPEGMPLDDRLVIKHDLTATVILRQIGHQVPNPINVHYDFGGATPFMVQRRTIDMMTTAPRCYVLNSMGTGKTKCTLWAWHYLHQQGLAGKLLVVCTMSTMRFTWEAEAFRTLPGIRVQVLHGTKKQRLERLNMSADIYIINHDGLRTVLPELTQRTDIDTLALDEVAVYRNNSDRSKDMRKFQARFKFVWGLTGRPMPNEPTDVWGISKVVTPDKTPKYFRQAQEMLMIKRDQFKWVPRPEAVDRAIAMLQPNVRFSLDEVVELPEVTYSTIDVPLTPKQARTYKVFKDEYHTLIEGGTITAVNAAVAMGKLLQISGGWVYGVDPNNGERIVLPSFKDDETVPRHQTLIDLVNENERKVIVYVPFRHAIEGLTPILDAAGVEHAVVHGEVSNRGDIFNAFQNTDKYKLLVAHPQCVAHGLTLTAADLIIWYMPITSLEIYEQANARITRIGQRYKQRILHLQSTPIEKKIYRMLRQKQDIQDTLLALLSEATAEAA